MTALTLPDRRVAIAGDWHGDALWASQALRAIQRMDPGIRTVLHLGDLWPDPYLCRILDVLCVTRGIERILLTAGNHEPWPALTAALDDADGAPAQLSEHVWVLPRPFRFEINGRTFLSLGGAASVDREWRVPGAEWWPDEQITDAMTATAIARGSADVMLTHETPAGTPVAAVLDTLRTNPLGFPTSARAESAASQQQIGRVWDAVRPRLLLHGHMHTAGEGTADDGRRVISLGCNGQRRNVLLLDTQTLTHAYVAV